MGATLANPPGCGPPRFRICGQIFHRSGNLHPTNGQVPLFNQLYIIDTDAANNYHMTQPANSQCRDDVMHAIQDVMDNYSPYLLAYRHMAEVEKSEMSKADNHGCQQSTITMQFRIGRDR